MSQIRQRSAAPQSDPDVDSLITRSNAGLAAQALLRSSPSQHGKALKLHMPFFWILIPDCLKNILAAGYCPSRFSPQWKERHLILLGRYLYRYKDEHEAAPKGSPIPLEAVDVRVVNASGHDNPSEIDLALQMLPRRFAVFKVSTFGKAQYFAVASSEEMALWVNSLREARQETITRNMGHSNAPYPKKWEYFDLLSSKLRQSKDRIKKKLDEANVREMEMSSYGDGGSVPRGYFG